MIHFLLFYNKSNRTASWMTDADFKHCDIITFDGDDYRHLSWDNRGIVCRRIRTRSCSRLISALRVIPELTALLVIDCEDRVSLAWRPLVVQTCNEFCRYVSGIDIGFTLTPHHLHRKVLEWSGKRNFKILSAWRRTNHGLGNGIRAESALAKPDSAK